MVNLPVGFSLIYQKDFDTVDHQILLKKLEHYGIREVALSLFRSYLTDRKQYFHLNGVNSEFNNITFGVPRVRYWVPCFSCFILMTY